MARERVLLCLVGMSPAVLPATVVAGLLPTRGKAATVQPKVTVRGLPQAWRGKHPWLTEGK